VIGYGKMIEVEEFEEQKNAIKSNNAALFRKGMAF